MLISPKTVEGYINRAKSKLSLHNRRDIVRFALENGLLRRRNERLGFRHLNALRAARQPAMRSVGPHQ